jgi:hypothetical protein
VLPCRWSVRALSLRSPSVLHGLSMRRDRVSTAIISGSECSRRLLEEADRGGSIGSSRARRFVGPGMTLLSRLVCRGHASVQFLRLRALFVQSRGWVPAGGWKIRMFFPPFSSALLRSQYGIHSSFHWHSPLFLPLEPSQPRNSLVLTPCAVARLRCSNNCGEETGDSIIALV